MCVYTRVEGSRCRLRGPVTVDVAGEKVVAAQLKSVANVTREDDWGIQSCPSGVGVHGTAK